MAWILVGLQPASRGGCNDLIISGHATVTSVLACAATSVAGSTHFSIAVWMLLAFDYMVEIVQGLHYSVDMWLGAVLTCLIWRLMEPMERVGSERTDVNVMFLPLSSVSWYEFVLYTLPALVACCVLLIMHESVVNYWIISYLAWAIGIVLKNQGCFTSFAQHVLFCMLFMAFGAYL